MLFFRTYSPGSVNGKVIIALENQFQTKAMKFDPVFSGIIMSLPGIIFADATQTRVMNQQRSALTMRNILMP
jgi:hypothetical protein